MGKPELDSYLYAQRFYFLAEQCLNIMQKGLGKTLRHHKLNHSQHLILLVLRYAEYSGKDVISTDIAYLLGLEKHSITTVVDKLVARKLVRRDRSEEDRRVVNLKLTPKGQELAAEIQAQTIPDISLVPEHAQEEFSHMCDFLQTLRTRIADATDQPAASYERAYETLLLEGQRAFSRSEDVPG
jgi:DNA-binding MarR family transcriptional regulator